MLEYCLKIFYGFLPPHLLQVVIHISPSCLTVYNLYTSETSLKKVRYISVFTVWVWSVLCYNKGFYDFQCKICDYSSLTQAGLDRHERICHIPDDRQFACKHCTYRGLKRRQLLDHERIVHTQDKNKYEGFIYFALISKTSWILKNLNFSNHCSRHICPVCKKSFRTQVLMKHHLPSHTDLHLYSCKGCSYT